MRPALALISVMLLAAMALQTQATPAHAVAQPPGITKSFSPSTIRLGETSHLEIFVTNDEVFDDLTGIGFSDTFPSGMTVANPPNVTIHEGCAGTGVTVKDLSDGTVTAGDTGIKVGMGALQGGQGCTVGVDVVTTATGTFDNTTTAVNSSAGTWRHRFRIFDRGRGEQSAHAYEDVWRF